MIKKLIGLLSTLAMVVVVALTVLLVGARFVGLTPYSVLSGSMEPTYSTGDLIYVKEIAPEEIQVGMPITYVANEHLVIATHRVTEIYIKTTALEPVVDSKGNAARDRSGNPIMQEMPLEKPTYYFRTKGDANETQDAAAVYEKNVIGTPVYRIPYLGHFVTLLQTTAGKVMAACFGLMLVLLLFLPEMLHMVERTDEKNGEGETQTDEAQEENDEDELICDEKAGNGDDIVLEAKNAEQGDDVVLKAEDAPKGDDVILEEGNAAEEKTAEPEGDEKKKEENTDSGNGSDQK